MTLNYADVARNAASLSLRVRRLANGETFQQDRDVLRSVAEKFRQFPDGPPTPDSDAEADVLAGLYGYFMLVRTLHEMDPGIWGVEQFKKRLEDYGAKLENLAHNRAQEPEKEELKRFFQTLRELADELVATGREPNPVFEFYHMLYGKSAPDAAKAFVAITAERDEAVGHLRALIEAAEPYIPFISPGAEVLQDSSAWLDAFDAGKNARLDPDYLGDKMVVGEDEEVHDPAAIETRAVTPGPWRYKGRAVAMCAREGRSMTRLEAMQFVEDWNVAVRVMQNMGSALNDARRLAEQRRLRSGEYRSDVRERAAGACIAHELDALRRIMPDLRERVCGVVNVLVDVHEELAAGKNG